MILSADRIRQWIAEGLARDREVLTTAEACEFLQISDRSLWNIIVPRGPLPYSMVGQSRRFLRSDLLAYVRAHRVTAAGCPSRDEFEREGRP